LKGTSDNSSSETDIITAIKRASSTHEDITSIELTRRISGLLITIKQ
jgi:flavin-binding protein dodecin